ncbi:MAG: hypothetical protein U0L45_02850 [Alistipes sp.]|nr:hypothetical protein [Alistipes sp.]
MLLRVITEGVPQSQSAVRICTTEVMSPQKKLLRVITEGVPQSQSAVRIYTTEVMSPQKAAARHHRGSTAVAECGADMHDRGNHSTKSHCRDL